MGYNFCEYKTFSRIYSAVEKCQVLLSAHKGLFQGYTDSYENIAKEWHTFRVIRNIGNHKIYQTSSKFIRTGGFL